MADRQVKHTALAPGDLLLKFKDVGDGTFALVVALEPGSIGSGGATETTLLAVRDRLPDALDADGGLKTHVQNFPATQAVSGSISVTNFPATQPVSGPLTDAQLRASVVPTNDPGLPDTLGQKTMANSAGVVLASDQSVIPVSDNAGSLTVDAPVGTPAFARLSDGAAALIGQKAMASSLPVTLASDQSVLPPLSEQRAATLAVTGTAAAGTGVTATLPAAGAGLFHYITRINIIKYASVATVGAAAPTVITSTNLPGTLAWTLPTALAVGTQYETDVEPGSPIKSSVANTATTIVAGALASIIYRITVYYFTAA